MTDLSAAWASQKAAFRNIVRLLNPWSFEWLDDHVIILKIKFVRTENFEIFSNGAEMKCQIELPNNWFELFEEFPNSSKWANGFENERTQSIFDRSSSNSF